jgi:hypothetical protein
MLLLLVLLLLLLLTLAGTASAVPLASGPSVSGLWPRQAVALATGDTALELSDAFTIRSSAGGGGGETRLTRAFARYEAIIRGQKTLWTRSAAPEHTLPLPSLEVTLAPGADPDAMPQLGDDEGFDLWVNSSSATLHAASFSGAHRGLEAFAQLTVKLGSAVIINSTSTHVAGKPTFEYRGLMLDTGRHFEPIPEILKLLDGMGASGLNCLHWHITDTQAWPWNSTSEPLLIQGAYRPDLVYQRTDLEAVVQYAADRAIRVLPEVDMPSHAASIALGRPELVIDCKPDNAAPLYDGSYQSSSQLDPSNPETFDMIEHLIQELVEIFPDEYLHFGGDEVNIPCYNSSAKIRAFMETKGWSTVCPPHAKQASEVGNTTATAVVAGVGADLSSTAAAANGGGCPGFKHLVAYFLRTVQALARKHGRKPSGWQEIFDHYGGNTSATPTPPFEGIDPQTVIYDWLAPGWGWGVCVPYACLHQSTSVPRDL